MTDPEPSPPAARRFPWSLAVSVAGLIVLALLATVVWPRLDRQPYRGDGNRARCASNLHQIGLAILLYQQDNAGQYPDTLGRLIEDEQIGAGVFVCPSSNDQASAGATTRAIAADIDAGPAGHHCSYVYVGRGLNDKTAANTTVVAYEPLTNHDGDGSDVLFGDGHVDWETKAEVAKLLATSAATRPTP